MDRIAFTPAGPEVISDNVDGVVVAINLLTGRYYSMSPAASVLWDRIQRGPAVLLSETSDPRAVLFLEELHSEGLVRRANPAPETAAIVDEPLDLSDLTVTAHSDLQELLALDPIHDVDPAAGWPQQPA
jgi:hypothetical protein